MLPAMDVWNQIPAPGEQVVCCCGDILTVDLTAPPNVADGTAWLRTNLGSARQHHEEIIAHVERHAPLLAGDWHDLPMRPQSDSSGAAARTYRIRLPIYEPGIYEAKAFFLPRDSTVPCWPAGPNLIIKAEPATTFSANMVYTAFVRQFGANSFTHPDPPLPEETLAALDASDWTLIPKSGTFRDLARELDHIIGTLGFRIVQLLPIHPVPTTFARMGRFGSPFAAIDFFNVDRALAEFDRRSTPLDQFGELVDGIHQRGARIYLDLPINHTGWASQLQVHHPEWFARNSDNTFASPGAWGVVWEDLSELDYEHRELWHYMANVFLFWCERGVDGFRCDAGYMIPLPVWEYIVAKVRASYPETVFLLEGLGGRISVTQTLLSRAGLNWAYSEIFQVYDRLGLEHQIQADHASARRHGALIHFAETHDNNRLAATSPAYAGMRTALAALTADAGAFGITNGVEWYATEKVDVHGAPSMNWGADENQIPWIQGINRVLTRHPAFQHGASLEILPSHDPVLQLLRTSRKGETVLVLINLDPGASAQAYWSAERFPLQDHNCIDLLTETSLMLETHAGIRTCTVPAGGALCLAAQPLSKESTQPDSIMQRAKALALALHARLSPDPDDLQEDPETLASALLTDPVAFCTSVSRLPSEAILTRWRAPADTRRNLPLPRKHLLLLSAPHPFRATLCEPGKACIMAESLPLDTPGLHMAILMPDHRFPAPANLDLRLTQFTDSGTMHASGRIQRLGGDICHPPKLLFAREHLRGTSRCAILANSRGAISQVRLEWARIESQYDAFLAANLHPTVPVDRHILFTRCRAWLVNKGYSHEIGIDCTRSVQIIPGQAVIWRFDAPAGMGRTVPLQFTLSWVQDENRIQLHLLREDVHDTSRQLGDAEPIQIILRPDIEDRSSHSATKAYAGPEHHWPARITTEENGFLFHPGEHAGLRMQLPEGRFTTEPEWLYAQPHPFEADRGLEPNGDLYSPGYFSVTLEGGQTRNLSAWVPGNENPPDSAAAKERKQPPEHTLESVLQSAIRDFVVRRDDARTVIAGYPWFLDWGRDTLICLRGMIAAGWIEESHDILRQFARFEQQGTIPNMIRGTDDRDRDTSDAPLWLFTACRDLLHATGDTAILEQDCGGRPLIAILQSIARHYMQGTPNGIRMDAESGLIFSPSHFTWMDTNYPAGTPRQGYPIEIQALWYAALRFLAEIDPATPIWQTHATQVQASILTLFRLASTAGALSDCLHAATNMPAARAIPDNAVRPNQLLAITLGAVCDHGTMADILRETGSLLIPGAIRSLADRPVAPPLPVYGPFGLLNNPEHPYQGHYRGDEDTRRKPAYHNGTAWTWPFPSYCEALALYDPDHLTAVAREFLYSTIPLMEEGCVGHIPEILDGDSPHAQRGCWAQAWGATEIYRVLTLLK
jgi:starch synthase (maltosyl-transferring)